MTRHARPRFELNSPERVKTILDTIYLIKLEGAGSGLKYLFSIHPEIRHCTHEHIAELLGLARETITRAYKHT